jgi:hypothetical protein
VTSTTYTAADQGLLSVRLRGDERSDWDLALFDELTGRRLDGSAAFQSNELARAFVAKGQAVRVQSCRRSGSDAAVDQTIQLTAVAPAAVTEKMSLVEVEARTPAQFRKLQDLGIDTTDHTDGDGQEAILYGADDARKLTEAGFVFHTKIVDLAAQDAADRASERRFARSGRRAATASGRTLYRDLEDYQADLKKLVEENPNDVRAVTCRSRRSRAATSPAWRSPRTSAAPTTGARSTCRSASTTPASGRVARPPWSSASTSSSARRPASRASARSSTARGPSSSRS